MDLGNNGVLGCGVKGESQVGAKRQLEAHQMAMKILYSVSFCFFWEKAFESPFHFEEGLSILELRCDEEKGLTFQGSFREPDGTFNQARER